MKKLLSVMLTFLFLVSFMTVSLAESFVMHTVDEGETYWKLSNVYQQDVTGLIAINQASDPALFVGDFIKIRSLNKNIDIVVDNVRLAPDASPYLENNRTFVPIRFIADALHLDIVWDSVTSTAIIKKGDSSIELPIGSNTARVNGINHTIDAPIKLYNNRVFVPLRFVSEILECTVTWDQLNYSVNINTGNQQTSVTSVISSSYSEDDLYWLSRIVSSESSGEPYAGKLAVANVIINRKKSNDYPNTIKSVVFDKNFGIQFTPVQNGTIYNTPTKESLQAAKEALTGTNNIGNSLFFVNSSKTTLNWIQTNRIYYKTIGNHDFYL